LADNSDRSESPDLLRALNRRELIKKALALGSASYVAPMIIGSVTPVSAQPSISGAGCSNPGEACDDESAQCNTEVSATDCGCFETVENELMCVFLDCPNDQVPESQPLVQTENCDDSEDCPPGWGCVNIQALGCTCGEVDNEEDPFLTSICMAPCLPETFALTGSSSRTRSGWPALGSLR
jgi:hypothetical protein